MPWVRSSFSVCLNVPLVGRKSEVAMGGGRGLDLTSPIGGRGGLGDSSLAVEASGAGPLSLAVEASGAGPLGAVGGSLALARALPTLAFGVVGR